MKMMSPKQPLDCGEAATAPDTVSTMFGKLAASSERPAGMRTDEMGNARFLQNFHAIQSG